MSSQIFKLDFKNGTLVIPSEAMKYQNQCQGEIEVSLRLTLSSTSLINDTVYRG